MRNAQFSVLKPQSASFFLSESADGLATAVVVVVGILLGTEAFGANLPGADLTAGGVIAFVFLVSLFSQPVRMGIEMLSEAQNAVAGWRRVLGVLDTPADVADPGGAMDPHTGKRLDPVPGADELPDGLLDIEIRDLRFSYPTGPEVLHGITVDLPARSRIAIVGETGSGKTTFAKLLTRMMDPASGRAADRRGARTPHPVRLAALARDHGAAGGLPLRHHGRRQPPLRPARRHRGRDAPGAR